MSFSFKIKSHPHKLLINHLREVCEVAVSIHEQNKMSFNQINNVDYNSLIKILCLTHDLGKATFFFQEFRLNDKCLENELWGNHAALSSLFTYSIGEEFLKQLNIDDVQNRTLSFMLFQIIRRHHTNLNDFEDEVPKHESSSFNKEVIQEQIKSIKSNYGEEFKQIISHIANELNITLDVEELFKKIEDINYFKRKIYPLDSLIKEKFEQTILEFYFEFSYLYGILLYSDKMSLADEKREYIDNCYSFKFNPFEKYKSELSKKNISTDVGKIELNKLRNLAFKEAHDTISENINEKLFVLNLPTGLGKTIISLSLAHELIRHTKIRSKIIYCLPFVSIIDQVSVELREKIMPDDYKEKLLKCVNEHQHLVNYSQCRDKKEDACLNTKIFVESWSSEITITTFEQILHSLLNNQNMRNMKIAKLHNSVIILDEVQSLPIEYYSLISKLINSLISKFNCKIIISTATYPLLMEQGIRLVNQTYYSSKLNRTKIINKSATSLSLSNLVNEIIPIVTSNNSSLIVGSSKKSYGQFSINP